MLPPERWNVLFSEEADLSQKTLKHRVAKEAREYLRTLIPGITISTNELGDALYPRAVAEQSLTGDVTRTKIFKLLGALATDTLADCCMKGEVHGQYMGRPKRPWLWFCPEDCAVCATCGQELPKDVEN